MQTRMFSKWLSSFFTFPFPDITQSPDIFQDGGGGRIVLYFFPQSSDIDGEGILIDKIALDVPDGFQELPA